MFWAHGHLRCWLKLHRVNATLTMLVSPAKQRSLRANHSVTDYYYYFFSYRCGAKPCGKTAELLKGNIHKVIDSRDSQLQTWAHRVLLFSFLSVIYMSLQHLAIRMHADWCYLLLLFTVHEKSVLLPVLPATLLALNEPQVLQYIVPIAVMSMLPLLQRDGLIIPYFALLSLFFLLPAHPVYGPQGKPNKQKGSIVKSSALNLLPFCSISGAVVLHLIYLFLHPPARYPFLFEALITVYCFVHFLALAIYTNWRQWFQPVDRAEVSADKEE